MPDDVLPSGDTCRAAADAAEGRVILVVGTFTLVSGSYRRTRGVLLP